MSSNDYPLNCLSDTGDGFSGWFAVSNPKICNDFCYWSSEPESNNSEYTVVNTADPHQTTVINYDNVTYYWECVFDAAGDDMLTSKAVGQRWIGAYQQYQHTNLARSNENDAPFPYLKCQKGPGEDLSTWDGELVKYALFWEWWIVVCAGIMLVQFMVIVRFLVMRRKRYELVGRISTDDISDDNGDLDKLDVHCLKLDETVNNIHFTLDEVSAVQDNVLHAGRVLVGQNQHGIERYKFCVPILCDNQSSRNTSKLALRIILVLVLNILLVLTITFSSISLMEINNSPHFKENMRVWTPACSNPDSVCQAGNQNINRESIPWTSNDSVTPFSYLISSDAQLNWFNGEFAQMGHQNIPPSCSPSDSCWSCTKKHGQETNFRLKRAWESLMIGEIDGMEKRNDTMEGRLPLPHTLIMNGDLTAYFHPSEKHAYESIYKDIQGLKNYFPSLGNHDIEHMSGAKYGGDQWNGPPNCNIEHAIGYFKGGLCGQIPKFHSNRIVRYDASSLAYSWDESRYHFVHTHYYPTYEVASMNFRSSMSWLEEDLSLARDAGLKTVLFVHAVNYLNPAMEKVILGKNVVAIIAGHDHRCLHRKCEGVFPIHEDQLDSGLQVEKCIPAAYDTCQVLNGENLVYVKDLDDNNLLIPKKKLKNIEETDKPLCPRPAPYYINETDNSLLCRKLRYNDANFPFENNNDSPEESIPIFWSGSASFETFLRADFFDDRIVINALALMEDGSVSRYIDANNVPNVRYPYHEISDLAEVVIQIK